MFKCIVPARDLGHSHVRFQLRGVRTSSCQANHFAPPLATASKYHDECGSHCSPQRQSLSAPVSRYGTRKSMSLSSLNPLVMPFEIPPGALVKAHESKYM